MLREMGLQAVVMTPSTSISDQLYRQFVEAFGKAKVGKFFDGKKELGKLITVANAQSLTKIQVDTPAWEFFSKSQVFFSDESHQCPAATLESVCFGLAKQAPYRFFFSATQIRNDGKDVVLDGITGPIVKTLTVREGVEKKYLAKPRFMMLEVESDLVVFSRDPGVLTRKHLYYNPKVVKAVANLVNQSVAKGMPTVVLIEEIEQFGMLLPYLETKPLFAHGALTDVNKKVVPPEYWDSDPNQLVAEFNDFKCPILVGTSCISTGTDIREVKSLVYWQGGKSEVQTKQSIGRGTRLTPTKSSFAVFDFDIINVDLLHRHAEARARIYEEMYGPVNYVEA
jgi:superfamily II DNA or RNA helicase